MNNEINLLPQKKNRPDKNSKQLRVLRIVAGALLLLVSTVTVGLFILTSFSPLPALQKEEEQVSGELDGLRDKVISYVVAHTRLSDIESYLNSREKYPETLEDMQSTGSQEITVSGVDFENRTITLNVTSPSLSSLNDMIISIKSHDDEQPLYKNFTLSDLSFNGGENLYSVGLQVELQ